VFQVNGEYVSSTDEVVSLFWKASYKYAYHCKIEVTPIHIGVNGNSEIYNCTQDEAITIVTDFMQEALPAIEECLPQRSILTD